MVASSRLPRECEKSAESGRTITSKFSSLWGAMGEPRSASCPACPDRRGMKRPGGDQGSSKKCNKKTLTLFPNTLILSQPCF